MHFFFLVILFVLCISMFVVSRQSKIGLLLLAGICIYEYSLPTSIGSCVVIMPLCFFLSEIFTLKKIVRACSIHKSILFYFLIIGIVYVFYSISISPYLQQGYAPFSFCITTVVRYMLPFVALICINKKDDVKIIFDILFVGILIMTGFAVTNLILHHSHYVDWLLDGKKVADYMQDAGGMYNQADRFRVQATFHNPFDYGYSCIACLLFFWFGFLKKIVSPTRLLAVIGCTVFGIIFCSCRTVLCCSIFIFMLFFFLTNKLIRLVGISVILILLLTLVSCITPFILDKFEFVLSAFDSESNVRGSSVEMRTTQLAAVLFFIRGYELFGRGIGFFMYDLGWENGREGVSGTGLYGLEGSYLETLLETGIIGTCFYFSIIIMILIWSITHRHIDTAASSLLFSLLFLFLIFGLMTGELRSAYITFLLSGIAFNFLIKKST